MLLCFCFQLVFNVFPLMSSDCCFFWIIDLSFYYVSWTTLTWKKGLGESKEKPKVQKKNGSGNMSQKQWSLSADCPQKTEKLQKCPFGGGP